MPWNVLENFALFTGKHLRWSRLQLYYKGTPTQLFEDCEDYETVFFIEPSGEYFRFLTNGNVIWLNVQMN